MIDKLLGAILGFGAASMLSKKKGSTYEKGGTTSGEAIQDVIERINSKYDGVVASETYSDRRIQVVSPFFNTLNEIKRKEFGGSGLMERYGNTSSYVLYSNKSYYAKGGSTYAGGGEIKPSDLSNWDKKLDEGEDVIVYDKKGVKYIYQGSSYEKDSVAVMKGFDESTYRMMPLSEIKSIEIGSLYAQGGLTKHGLKKGDTLGEFEGNAVTVYPNNEDEKYKVFQVNLNKGVRMDASKYLELSPSEKDAFNKMSRGGTTSAEDKVHNAVLKIRQSYRFPYNAQRGLDDLDENGSKYKLAVALLMRKKHPNILPERVIGLNLDDDKDYMRYANMLRHLEKLATAESPNETKWRTENYSLNDAENWATEALEKAYTVSMSGNKKKPR